MSDIVFVCMTCRKRTACLESDVNDMVYLELEDGICNGYKYPCTKCPEYEPAVEHDNSKEKEMTALYIEPVENAEAEEWFDVNRLIRHLLAYALDVEKLLPHVYPKGENMHPVISRAFLEELMQKASGNIVTNAVQHFVEKTETEQYRGADNIVYAPILSNDEEGEE